MKYIRTKQGCIVDTTNMHSETLKWYQEVHLLKQADTIEELCDMFIYIQKREDKVFWWKIDDHFFTKEKSFDGQLFGAIWTDKGLIYVAKMNEKGEFELL